MKHFLVILPGPHHTRTWPSHPFRGAWISTLPSLALLVPTYMCNYIAYHDSLLVWQFYKINLLIIKNCIRHTLSQNSTIPKSPNWPIPLSPDPQIFQFPGPHFPQSLNLLFSSSLISIKTCVCGNCQKYFFFNSLHQHLKLSF